MIYVSIYLLLLDKYANERMATLRMHHRTTLMHSLSSMLFLDIPFHLVQETFPTGTIPHVYQDHYRLDCTEH